MSVRISTSKRGELQPISASDLRAYFEASGKPVSRWRVGAEYEKFVVDRATARPLSYDEPGGLRDIMLALVSRFRWTPYHNERGHVTALVRDGASVSLEPGGQFEFATAPASHIAEIEQQLANHLAELRAVTDVKRVAVLAIGVAPMTPVEEIALMPRVRHEVMAEYLPLRSPTALWMMKATASTQVALDYSDEADAVRKFTTALKLGSIVNTIWGNAPLLAGKRTDFVSVRGEIWRYMDPDRSGLLVPLLEAGFSFASWVEYLLDVPMMFTYLDGRYRPAGGVTFRDFMTRGIDEYFPTIDDWEMHVTTVFPEVRMKSFIEVRGADAAQRPLSVAVPALWKGLMYDAESLHAAARIAAEIRPAELPELFAAAYHDGLQAVFHGRELCDWCRELAGIAANGLQRLAISERHLDERSFLDSVFEILSRGRSPGAEYRINGPDPSAGARGIVDWFEYEVHSYQI